MPGVTGVLEQPLGYRCRRPNLNGPPFVDKMLHETADAAAVPAADGRVPADGPSATEARLDELSHAMLAMARGHEEQQSRICQLEEQCAAQQEAIAAFVYVREQEAVGLAARKTAQATLQGALERLEFDVQALQAYIKLKADKKSVDQRLRDSFRETASLRAQLDAGATTHGAAGAAPAADRPSRSRSGSPRSSSPRPSSPVCVREAAPLEQAEGGGARLVAEPGGSLSAPKAGGTSTKVAGRRTPPTLRRRFAAARRRRSPPE
eukprot:3014835-Prymnesium_polylepis.1